MLDFLCNRFWIVIIYKVSCIKITLIFMKHPFINTLNILWLFYIENILFIKKVVTLFKSYDLLFFLYLICYLKNSSFSIVSLPILSFEYELPLYLFQSVNTVSNSLSDFSYKYSFGMLYFSRSSLLCLGLSFVKGTFSPRNVTLFSNLCVFISYT